MNLKQLEKLFKKNIHQDIREILDISFLPIQNNKYEVYFLEDFEDIEYFKNDMISIMEKYYENPDKYYKIYCGSSNINENIIAIIDKRTGFRSLNQWGHIKSDIFEKFLDLRNRYN